MIALQPISKMPSNSVMAPGPTGMPDLHQVGGLQQPAGFGQQPEPGQITQQAAEHVLPAARGDDPLRVAALAQGDVQAAAA